VVAVSGNGILQENGEVDHAMLREIVFSDTTKHKQLNRFVFSLNFEPAFKASCFGHANKEFPFSCQVRFDFIAKSEGFSDSVLLKLLFL
jgi:hypothetical protein